MGDERGRGAAGDGVWAEATADPLALPAVRGPGELAVRSSGLETTVVEVVFGAADVVLAVLEGLAGSRSPAARQTHDVVMGLAWVGYRATARAAGAASAVISPAVRLAVDPPLVPKPLRLRSLANRSAVTWRRERPTARRSVVAARDVVVPAVVDAALSPIDLTGLVLARVDLAAVVREALDRLDLTEVVVEQVDLAQVVAAALDQLDLTDVVVQQVDLAQVIGAALDQLNLTDVVVQRVDLAQVVSAAVTELDLNQIVVEQVDLGALVGAALDQVDLNQIVRERVDLVGIAQEVIDAVDLPEIIRESTGSVASETVRAVRMQSIDADQGVQRAIDRVILWRRGRNTDAPGEVDAFGADDAVGTP